MGRHDESCRKSQVPFSDFVNINGGKFNEQNGSAFGETQSIPTNAAYAWESFTIDGQLYLAVANEYNGSSYSINSEIFRMESPIADAGGEYMAPGFYDIVLTVTDNDGLTDTDDTILAVFGLKGDFDQDGDVDGNDLSRFAQNFGW